MIKALCGWLSGRILENSAGSVDLKGRRLSGNKIRDCGVGCLSMLFENTCGMEVRRETSFTFVSTGRMKELWMNRGKEEEEEEWKRKWREIVDVMREEDVVETLSMMLCIRRDERNDNRQTLYDDEGMMVGSVSSMWGMFGLGGGIVEGCHFDVHDNDDTEGRSVIIRNLPSGYVANMYIRDQLQDAIHSKAISMTETRQPSMRSDVGKLDPLCILLPVVIMITKTEKDAIKLEETINGMEFKGRGLIAKRIREIRCDDNQQIEF